MRADESRRSYNTHAPRRTKAPVDGGQPSAAPRILAQKQLIMGERDSYQPGRRISKIRQPVKRGFWATHERPGGKWKSCRVPAFGLMAVILAA